MNKFSLVASPLGDGDDCVYALDVKSFRSNLFSESVSSFLIAIS